MARFAVLLVLCSAASVVASNASDGVPTTVRPARLAPALPLEDQTPAGSLPGGSTVRLTVDLEPSGQGAVAALLRDLYDPSSPDYHQWLAPGEFAQRFAPSPAVTDAVLQWLSHLGMHPSMTSPFTISASASSDVVSRGLGITFRRYREHHGLVFAANRAPEVPTQLASDIAGVEGLSNAPASTTQLAEQPQLAPQSPIACGAAATYAYDIAGYTADQLGAAYGIDALTAADAIGQGQTIGLFELGSSSATDIGSYESCLGLSNTVSVAKIDGGAGSDPAATAEADVDIEQAITQAPGASVISYEGPNTTQGVVDLWRQIVTADAARVVSVSWGICEAQTTYSAAVDPLLQQAAAQGQAVFASAGDAGSEDCDDPGGPNNVLAVDYPGSSPWVTAVGGTSLSLNGSEVVWNACQGVVLSDCDPDGAGGGGVSGMEPKPIWQASLVTPSGFSCGSNGSDCREVPDISVDAGVSQVFYAAGKWGAFAGTSLSSPFVAGMWADRQSACSQPLSGDAASVFYSVANDYGTALNDITSGDNDFTGTNGGDFAAGPGFDLASGLGSPRAAGIACAEVTGVAPSQSPAGSTLTVSGLGLEHASISFGSGAATVLRSTATSATVVVPDGSGTVTVTATGPLGAGIAVGSFTYGPAPAGFSRIAGTTAIGTAVAVSQARFPADSSAPAAVLARSDFFSDALAGGPLAARVNGPLLITPGASQSSSLDPAVLAELQRVLEPNGTVYVLGGPLALSPAIDGTLTGLGYRVVRLAGSNEFATAVAVAQQLGNPSVIFEATGLNFPDALSAVPAAVQENGAILLTNGTTQAPETAAYLTQHPTDTRYAIGGPLAAAGADPSATAVYGQDQYGTAAAVASTFFPNPTEVGAATGTFFSDALAGGPLLGLAHGPLLLVAPTGPLPPAVAAYLGRVGAGVTTGIVFGGPLAVADAVVAELDAEL